MTFSTTTTSKLGEVLEVLSGGAWGTADDPDGARVLRTNNIARTPTLDLSGYASRRVPQKVVDRLRMRDGDIVMTKSNSIDRVGECGLFVQPTGDRSSYIPSNFCQLLRFNPNIVEPWFGLFWLRSAAIQKQIKSLAVGTSASLKNISAGKLRELEIAYPGLQEQRRLIDKLRPCFDRLDEITTIQKEARLYPQHARGSFALELMGLETLRNWSDAYAHSGPFEWLPLENVCAYISRGRHHKQGASDTYLIKTRHVWPEGVKDYADCPLAASEAKRLAESLVVRQHDILIACSARGSLGRCCYIGDTPARRVTVDTHVAIVRPNGDVVSPRFLFEFLNSPVGRYLLVSAEAGGRWHEEKIGFRFAELNLPVLKQIKIPVPHLERQRRIVAQLAGLDASLQPMVRECDEMPALCEAAGNAILRQGFAGEL